MFALMEKRLMEKELSANAAGLTPIELYPFTSVVYASDIPSILASCSDCEKQVSINIREILMMQRHENSLIIIFILVYLFGVF